MKFWQMKSVYKRLAFLCVLCASAVNCVALDREAFTFTNYDLNVQVEPEQHRLGVRGKVTLRNDLTDFAEDSRTANLVVTRLALREGRRQGCAVRHAAYTSDIDHTGGLSEAIVTLPEAIAPKGTIELDIAYEGVILLDATRLTRIGTPEDLANSTDWDQIGPAFTAVRGAGYVAWYPIATDVANLSEGDSLFEVLGRWKNREAGSRMHLQIGLSRDGSEPQPELLVNNASCFTLYEAMGGAQHVSADCTYQPLGLLAPLFVVANYHFVDRPTIVVHYQHGHDSSAAGYADAAENVVPLITDWFGKPREKAQMADLADPHASPYESAALLLTPLADSDSRLAGLVAAHQLTHTAFFSFRPWIEEGLAHFAQALYLEHEKGRQAALDYMGLHRFALSEINEPTGIPHSEDEVNRSLANTTNEELYRSKAMYVWWMLRDIVGEPALKKAIAAYRPEQDKEPSYMPRLIAAQTQRDLEWFFDDWVYRDRGLPDFKVESAYSRKTMTGSFMLTITIDNLGNAGAEVPVTIKFTGGEIMRRLKVHAKNKAVIRVETPAAPQEITVNDGSVPESNRTNNTFKIEQEAK